MEYVNLLMSPQGPVLSAHVAGKIQMKYSLGIQSTSLGSMIRWTARSVRIVLIQK